jgi:hypothetical protein
VTRGPCRQHFSVQFFVLADHEIHIEVILDAPAARLAELPRFVRLLP